MVRGSMRLYWRLSVDLCSQRVQMCNSCAEAGEKLPIGVERRQLYLKDQTHRRRHVSKTKHL